MIVDILLVAVGIAVLGFAGDRIVTVAAALAEKARVTPAVVGLTVVAAGTSFPELFVSLMAAYDGTPDIAVGNVVGSNIGNVALILGVCALVAPVPVSRNVLKLDYPFMLVASAVVYLCARGGSLDRVEGAFFLAGNVAFMAYSVWLARRQLTAEETQEAGELVPAEANRLAARSYRVLVLGIVAGLAGLSVGANLLVRGAISIAAAAGMSQRVVGLTVVAIGTSLPELVASLAAAAKKQHDMAIANIVGSNIFNVLGILGMTALASPIPIGPGTVETDLPVMLAVSALLLPMMLVGRRIGRADGAALIAVYAGYTIWLLR